MIRRLSSLIRFVSMGVWTAVLISAALVLGALTRDPTLPLRMARRPWAPGMLWLSGARLEVRGLPALDWSAPHLFVMNHQSALDIPVAFAVLPTNLRFIAKHSLRAVPFLGWYMAWTGMVFVNRSQSAQAVESLRAAAEQVGSGRSLIAYPEGTRSPDGNIQPLKKGCFALALQAGIPVVPVAIEGSGRVMPSRRILFVPGPVRIRVGDPISTAGRGIEARDALAREVHAALVQLHASLLPLA